MVTSAEDVSSVVRELARALLDNVDMIAGRSAGRMQELLPSYAKVPTDALIPVVLTNMRNLLDAVAQPDADHGAADRHFQVTGETRLRQGITVDEMLQAWRIALDVVREEAHPVAQRLEVSDAALLAFIEATLRWGDVGMRRSTSAHREGEIRELERLTAEQSALRRVAELVARQASREEVLALVTQELSSLLAASLVCTVRFEQDGSATITAAQGRDHVRLPPGTNFPIPSGGVLELLSRTGRPARIDDFAQVGGHAAAIVREEGAQSMVGGPIVVDGRLWGAMLVASQADEPLPPGSEDRVARFAELVSTAISNTEARSKIEQLAAEQAALRRVAELVAQQAPPEEVFALVTKELSVLFGSEQVGTMRFEEDGTATVVAERGPEPLRIPPGTNLELPPGGVLESVLRTGRPVRIDDYARVGGPTAAILREEGVRSMIGGPIVVDGRLWGAMLVGVQTSEALPPGSEYRVARFAELVSTAISNIESRAKVERLAAEQSALRRVATLVAREHSSDEIFAALAEEIGVLFEVDASAINRYNADSTLTVVAGWSDRPVGLPVGKRFPVEAGYLAEEVRRTGKPGRKVHSDAGAGPTGAMVREVGIRSAVASPIIVAGEIWGTINVISLTSKPLPPDTEERLAEFSRHAGMAVANAKNRSDLTESRARIVRTADEARRRFERDLHDGAQQRLVSLGLELRAAEAKVPAELNDLQDSLSRLVTGVNDVLDDLRELSRGLHPAVLSEDGLAPALSALARRSAVPVAVSVDLDSKRFEEPVEVAAYYVVSEALTNTAKHAGASRAAVTARLRDSWLELTVSDNGRGGADALRGSGLRGLVDRVEAIGGTIRIESDRDRGTAIHLRLPTTSPRA
jgi:signal transduction histidine kinase